MDAGAVLRHERERLGLSLQSISAATKITVPALRAIENHEVDLLPSGIYLRGFLRAYAREVGLDPERVVLDYTAPPEPPPSAEPNDQRPAPPSARPPEEPARSSGVPGRHMAAGMLVIQIVIAVGALYALIRERESTFVAATPDESSVIPSVPSGIPSIPPTPREIGTSGAADQYAAHEDAERVIRVEIATTGPCWVEAIVDGRPVIYRLMDAGERHSIAVENELRLLIGDPATFVLRVDGSAGRSFGRPGVPATARLTRTNIHEFIAGNSAR